MATLTESHVITTTIGVAEFETVVVVRLSERISLIDSSTIKNASDENCSARR
jgi:hypothetical protein